MAASAVRPGFMTMMGLVRATSRAADRKLRASPTVSMYITMASVSRSLPRWSMRSPQPTSAIEPSDTMELKPTFSRSAQSSTAVTSAPLWLMNATRPRGAMAAANVALRPLTGLITPRQLGPMSRIRCRRASAATWRSSSAPSPPISLNPAEMTMTAGTLRGAAFGDQGRDAGRGRHDRRPGRPAPGPIPRRARSRCRARCGAWG